MKEPFTQLWISMRISEMYTKTWFVLLLFVAGGSVALGAEPAEVIWWAAKERSRSRNVRRPASAAPTTSPGRPDGQARTGSGHHPSGISEGTSGGAAGTDETLRGERPRGMPEAMMRRMRDQGKRPEGMPEGMRGMRGRGGGRSRGMPSRGEPADGTSGERQMPSRTEMMAAMRKPKPLLLRWGDFPSNGDKESAVGKLLTVDSVEAWIRTPDGTVTRADLNLEGDTVATKCPPETEDGAECPNGIYVVGMHLDAGVMDFDADGEMERVHFYSNGLVSRYSRGGVRGDKPDVLFKDAEKMALEIAPSVPDSGNARYMLTSQTALQEHKMQVLYKGRPLANAEVAVLTESGWKKTVTTDSHGIMSITPIADKPQSERPSGMRASRMRGSEANKPKSQPPSGMRRSGMGTSPAPESATRGSEAGTPKTERPSAMRGSQRAPFAMGGFGMRGDKYLYVVLHKEPVAGEHGGTQYTSEYHCASLCMDVRMPRPERNSTRSKPEGFNLLTISGMGLFIAVVTLAIYRKKKLDRETMVKFDEHRICRD